MPWGNIILTKLSTSTDLKLQQCLENFPTRVNTVWLKIHTNNINNNKLQDLVLLLLLSLLLLLLTSCIVVFISIIFHEPLYELFTGE